MDSQAKWFKGMIEYQTEMVGKTNSQHQMGKETSKQKPNAHSCLNKTAQNAVVHNSYKSKFHKKSKTGKQKLLSQFNSWMPVFLWPFESSALS